MVIDNRVRVSAREIGHDAVERVKVDFTHDNPEYKKRKAQKIPVGDELSQIATWLVDGDELSVPRGGCARLCRALDVHRVDFEQDDARSDGDDALLAHYEIPDHRVELRPYQAEALASILDRENCIVHLGTGGGKTTIAMALVAAVKRPALVVVPDLGLLDQWVERVVSELGLREDQVGQIGGGKWSVRPITIATDDTLHARPEAFAKIAGKFGTFVYDEVHGAAARTIFAIVDQMPARIRVGFSNDSSRKDRKEFLVHDLFGSVAYEKSARELAELGFILDVEVRVVPTDFDAPWYKAAFVEASRTRSRARFANVQTRLIEQMIGDDRRNDQIIDWVLRERGESSAVVLSQRVEHAVDLDRRVSGAGVRTGMVLGGQQWKKQFRATVAELRAGTVGVAFGTIQAFGTGKDIPKVATVFVTTPLANHKQNFAQVRGRACRLGKDSARLYYFWDSKLAGRRAIENLVKWNKTVKVWSAGEWVEGRAFVRRWKQRSVNDSND